MSDLPDPPILQYATPAIDIKPRPLIPGMLRFCGIYAGVLVPLVSFGFTFAGFPLGPEWQSGKLADYIKLMLHAQAAWPLFPLLLYSIICAALVSAAPRHFVDKAWVRTGLWGGVPMALLYSIILLVGLTEGGGEEVLVAIVVGVVAMAVSAFLVWLLNWFFWRFGARRVWPVLGTLIGLCVLVPAALGGDEVLGVPLFGSIILGPGWAMLTCLALAVRSGRAVREIQGTSRVTGGAIGAWFAAFTASWGLAIEEAIRMYRSLPTSPPSHCYIATAAAKGHPVLVRSRQITLHNQTYTINPQLQRLKCAEIALATIAPRLHQFIRRIYDCIGPQLAQIMDCKLSADVSYLLLLPIEKLTTHLLRRLLPNFDHHCAHLYSPTPGRGCKAAPSRISPPLATGN